MSINSLKIALTSFIETVNETFASHYSLEGSGYCYRVITDDSRVSSYRLAFLPSYLLSVANFSVSHGKIVIDFFFSEIL